MAHSGVDYEELVCQARGSDRRGALRDVPAELRTAAARRLVDDGIVTVDQLEGLPLDDLFNLVGLRRREQAVRDSQTR